MSTKKLNLNINDLPVGEQITLEGADARMVKYVRTLETKPKKAVDKGTGQPVLPQPYAQMRIGTVSFTINTDADIEIVSDADRRDDVFSYTLEVTEYEREALDAKTGAALFEADGVTPVTERTKGWAFVDLMTYDSRNKLAKRDVELEGTVFAEKVKFGLPTGAYTVDDAVAASIKSLEAKALAAKAEEAVAGN